MAVNPCDILQMYKVVLESTHSELEGPSIKLVSIMSIVNIPSNLAKKKKKKVNIPSKGLSFFRKVK
jgi:flagellar assembly factor FliW